MVGNKVCWAFEVEETGGLCGDDREGHSRDSVIGRRTESAGLYLLLHGFLWPIERGRWLRRIAGRPSGRVAVT